MTNDEHEGYLEPSDLAAIDKLIQRRIAEQTPKGDYDYQDGDDLRPRNEQRAHKTFVREQLKQQGLEADEGVDEGVAFDAWEQAHDQAAYEQCLEDTPPKPAAKPEPVRPDMSYDHGDPL